MSTLLKAYFNDTVSGGDWLCEQDVVEYFVEHCTEEMIQLEQWGCPWSRKDDGHINVRYFGGMKMPRTWFAADRSGFHILHTLFQTSLKYPQIRRYDEFFCTDLLVEDGRVCGVLAVEIASGERLALFANAVVMATGGAGRVFRQNTNAGTLTGDGMGMGSLWPAPGARSENAPTAVLGERRAPAPPGPPAGGLSPARDRLAPVPPVGPARGGLSRPRPRTGAQRRG